MTSTPEPTLTSAPPDYGVTPTPTYTPSIPDVRESVVRGLDSPLKFTPNKYYNFTVTGAGTTNTNPGPGDVKWVPVYWSTSPNPTDNRKNTTWRIGSAKGINKAATYNMYIFFQKYVYQKAEWKKTDEVQSAVYQFRSASLTTVKLTTGYPALPTVLPASSSNGKELQMLPATRSIEGPETAASGSISLP